MTVSTRLALVVLTIGFLIEGVGEILEFSHHWYNLPGNFVYLFYAGPASTVVGFLFAFIGRHEWSELHRRHVIHAHRFLAVAIILLVSVVGAVLGIAAYAPTEFLTGGVPILLGVAAAIGLGSSFVSYMLICYHLTTTRGKVLLAGALVWAAIVSAFTGYELATNFGEIIGILHTNPLSLGEALNTLTFLTTILFVSYFLLTLAYHDAYRQLQKGVLPKGHVWAIHHKHRPGESIASPTPDAPAAPPPL